MQDGSPNGPSPQDDHVTTIPDSAPRNGSVDEESLSPVPDELITAEPNDAQAAPQADEPPSKKRRLTESSSSQRSTPRPPSPPWKKAGYEGPTSFLSEGKRRSSRTNTVPIELQSPSDKRNTRGAQNKNIGKSARDGSKPVTSSPLSVTQSRADVNGKLGGKSAANGSPRAPPSRAATSKLQRVSQTPASKPSDSRARSRSSATLSRPSANANGTTSRPLRDRQSHSNLPTNVKDDPDDAKVDGDGPESGLVKVPRIRLKMKKPVLPIRHPGHIPLRKHASFRDWVHHDDRANILSEEEAIAEAQKRNEVMAAAEPGGPLSSEVCSAYITDQQEEPPPQYSHQDHLVAHALYFQKLLDKEHKRHRQTAKLFAQWCADAYRKRHKDPEDILREQKEELRGKRKQLSKDLQKMFDLARAEIDRARLARWEEERKVEDQKALDRAITKSTMLFEKRRAEILGEVPSDTQATSDDEHESASESGSQSGSGDEDESNMSGSESGTDDETNVDDDAKLTEEELRLKYANLPTEDYTDRMSVASATTAMTNPDEAIDSEAADHATPNDNQLDDVDSVLMDDSDASTDMDDDMGDSEEEEEEGSSEEEDSDDEGEDRGGLMGFFSKKDISVPKDSEGDEGAQAGPENDENVKSTSEAEDEAEFEDPDEVSLVPIAPTASEGTSLEGTPLEVTENSGASPDTGADTSAVETPAADTPMEDARVEAQSTDGNDEPDQTTDEPQSMDLDQTEEIQPTGGASSDVSPGTVATKPSEPESISSLEPAIEKALQTSHSPAPGLQTPVPHLLRGTLREYQHYGLDWLAGLYNNHINGILADEMGLGKTIQTIALLAHLAVDHGIWGPHLVVVPTSVMLNWEMEFKKWCPGFKIMTYYGNQEERKQKRRGWTDDNAWNVLITSYQLVLQDQQSLKRRNWQYMILDEAHNIKNFRSQRWQALLTFKSRARLLLTGTPLQNNLTELWSLLFFLMPSDGQSGGVEGFADLKDFSEWFRRPVEQILEHGRDTMDEEAKGVITKLHTVLRPYLLRRLKADVEKQMPGKYEHVVYCRLSKRQRFLYDGFMSMAQTKETLASGNFLSIIHCLMQLRKVCNHPDLFETRPISTSFAMPRSVPMDFNVKESLVRRRLLFEHPLTKIDLDFLNLAPVSREDISRRLADDSIRLMAIGPFKKLRERQYNRTNWEMGFDGSNMTTILESLENACRKRRMAELERCLYFESKRHGRRPVYGSSLIEFIRAGTKEHALSNAPLRKRSMADWLSSRSAVLASMILTIEERGLEMDGYVQRFACVTPSVIAAGMNEAALTPVETRLLTNTRRDQPYDPFHQARMRLSIAFPDKRLLQRAVTEL
ncbi:unnamed protein product [Penicillium salamii]|nr:unnamed protein product [Penicillium salamii]